MQRKPIIMAAGAAVLAIAVLAAGFVLAAGSNSGGDSASNALASSQQQGQGADSSSSAKTTPAQCWDAYGAAETALANTLSKSLWKQTRQDSQGSTMALDGISATVVTSSDSATEISFGLRDAKSETIEGDGETIVRTTATAVDENGKEYALTLDTSQNGSSLTCELFGSGVWNPSGEAGDLVIDQVSASMDALIGGNGQKMREAVAAYAKENVPLTVRISYISIARVDTDKNMAYVNWIAYASSNKTLMASINLSTGEIAVEKLES